MKSAIGSKRLFTKVLVGAVVTIHVESEHKAKHSGILVL